MKTKLELLKEQEIHQVHIGGIVYEMVKVHQAEVAMERYAEQFKISSNTVLADSVCLHEWDEGSHNVHKCTKCGNYNC